MTEPQLPLQERILALVKHPQFYWWCGNVCLLCNSILYFTSVLSLHSITVYYKRAFAGALVSYGVVIWKSIGIPRRFDIGIIRNENVQYFALAFYWYSYSPISVTLIPFFIFSIFHTFAYIRTQVVPTLFPENSNPMIAEACRAIKQHTDEYHERAMQLAAYVEVIGVTSRLLIGVISFQTSVLALIVFIHFLRLRYYLSPFTREAIQRTTAQLDLWLLPPNADNRVPQQISSLYKNIKGLAIRYGSANSHSEDNTVPSRE